MKRLLLILPVCALLAACSTLASGAATEPTAEAAAPEPTASDGAALAETVLYLPAETADGLVKKTVVLPKQDIDALVAALVENGALPAGTAVRSFRAEVEGGAARQGTLDMNDVYGDAVCGTGTAGEAMLLGSLVNTVLDAFMLDSVMITCEGNVLESGHAVYNEPLTAFSFQTAERGAENAAFTALAADAAADVLALIVNIPDAAALEAAPARTEILPGESDLALIVPRYCGSHITLYAVTYTETDAGTFEFVRDKVLFDDPAIADGFALYGGVTRPEGAPCYELVVQSGENALSYLFAYDGRDGVSPLELLTAK